jgi:hypothetical protein
MSQKPPRSIRTMLRLRAIEWVPIIAAILINVVTGLYMSLGIMQMFDDQRPLAVQAQEAGLKRSLPMSQSQGRFGQGELIVQNRARIFEIGKIATTGLLFFGVGCWLWRFNRWIRESE